MTSKLIGIESSTSKSLGVSPVIFRKLAKFEKLQSPVTITGVAQSGKSHKSTYYNIILPDMTQVWAISGENLITQ